MYPKPVEIRLAVRDIKSYPPMLNILKDEIEELRVPLKDKETVQEISRKLKGRSRSISLVIREVHGQPERLTSTYPSADPGNRESTE